PCGAAARTGGSGLPGCDAWAMARHARRAAYAIDVSAGFPALIVGRVSAVADAQSRRTEHFAPPRHRRRLRRSYRARRLVGRGAAATGGRSAKVTEDDITFLKTRVRVVHPASQNFFAKKMDCQVAFRSARTGQVGQKSNEVGKNGKQPHTRNDDPYERPGGPVNDFQRHDGRRAFQRRSAATPAEPRGRLLSSSLPQPRAGDIRALSHCLE